MHFASTFGPFDVFVNRVRGASSRLCVAHVRT